MHTNSILPMTDTRRLSPQTTSSSGYHSDLSLTNDSPRCIKETRCTSNEKSNFHEINQTINDHKSIKNKNFFRISTFVRKQYERAKSKLLTKKQHSSPIKTCSKATSTTPLSYLADINRMRLSKSLSSTHQQNSFIEPQKLQSIHVYPLHNNQMKISSGNYASVHQHLSSYPEINHSRNNSHSYNHLASIIHHQNINTSCLSNNDKNNYRQNYSMKSTLSQSYYPYKYLYKNYDFSRSSYAPLSDFVSTTTTSAFKPIKFYRRPSNITSELIPISDDPCDLEVAQYFHQTPQWSNPNYFDIYTKEEMPSILPKKDYTETLC